MLLCIKMLRLRICGCVLGLSFCYLLVLAVAHITDPSEVNALVAIKKSLVDPMGHLRNWKKGDPCKLGWTGVLCSDAIGKEGYLHVQELQLLNMNLSGNLAPEIGQLSHLLILDFMWNELTGPIPKEIGTISSLRLLLLNGNKLSGSLPGELGNLSNLNRLQVDQNNISGQIPESFANLSSVKHLHLNNNTISGRIPAELSQLSTLLHLLLDSNNLFGNLPPELSDLPMLRILQLDNNNFSGSEIPASYRNFSRLVKLTLRNCSLQGAIPDFSRLRELKYLDLSWNHLTGTIPSNKLSDNIITIYLSDNHINGSIPGSFSDLPSLQTLSLKNNVLTGSVPSTLWQNMSLTARNRRRLDLRNNLFSNILGDLNPPGNVTLRLAGNPICNSADILNVEQFCGSEAKGDGMSGNFTNSTHCPIQACPTDYFFEYVPASPVPCFCAAPIRIEYRLKSPSFSYFPPYFDPFELYLSKSLSLDLYQLSIDSFVWEGPRLRMHLKLFPLFIDVHSNTFNTSEIQRIRSIFTTWRFPSNDLFGPYELLSFTLLGPYSNENTTAQTTSISKRTLAFILAGAFVSTVALSTIFTLFIVRRHSRQQGAISSRRSSSKASIRIDGVKDFDFRELASATDNFNNSVMVGRGGYGKVYKGILSDKTAVAIKRAEEGSLQGRHEFLTEIKLLSRLHHRNLVSLIGYCDEEGEQMLVYEFMPNGTLRDWLSGKAERTLSFDMRVRIALGSAKGILYLHTEAHPPVFHRDIKATNILLDCNLNAKVADFGLSRLAPVLDEEGAVPAHVSTIVKGTPGYLDPEYFLTRKLTDKSDVYSLGVVFLELLTGMQPITHGKNIVREVKMAYRSGMIFSVIDQKMGPYPSECVEKFACLSLSCCHDLMEKRPSMQDVVRELEIILKMIPGTDQIFSSESSSLFSNQSPMLSSTVHLSSDNEIRSTVSGSDLISSVVPTITPR